jgi:hypothetical protein
MFDQLFASLGGLLTGSIPTTVTTSLGASLSLSLALGLSHMDDPNSIEERHAAMSRMVESLGRNVELSSQLPFKVEIKKVNMSKLALSPIYSFFRGNVCEIHLNSNPHTHLNYQVLASQQTGQTDELNPTSLAYTLGHEIGHCMYKHLILRKKPVNTIYQLQKDYWGIADKVTHPLQLDIKQRPLHEEVYADEFGIALAAAWQHEDLAQINNKVIEFRKSMSAFDSKRNTHYYIPQRREKTALSK